MPNKDDIIYKRCSDGELRKVKMTANKTDECEWCGMNYPKIAKEDFMILKKLFGKYDHIICRGCYEHMESLY